MWCRHLRTNFFQTDPHGLPKAGAGLQARQPADRGAPEPRPFAEIFVYSPRIEGVHLRFGKIARGGLRWSDRQQDFRTEVLGLVKAQQVKNAVIVPVGAKGGFVAKQLPAGGPRGDSGRGHRKLQDLRRQPARRHRQSRRQHVLFRRNPSFAMTMTTLSGRRRRQGHRHLLRHRQRDLRKPELLARRRLRRPAARRATTTRRWALPPAAAGRRSSAISARWTATSRGNRSRWSAAATCRATCSATPCCCRTDPAPGAFDHRDIFIDPDPDPAKSFAERKRLFELPRSTWQDYSRQDLISKGGGVFSRADKSIR
jgi:glutamate dehydrogenase